MDNQRWTSKVGKEALGLRLSHKALGTIEPPHGESQSVLAALEEIGLYGAARMQSMHGIPHCFYEDTGWEEALWRTCCTDMLAPGRSQGVWAILG